jgi:hypothetical protein
MQVTWYFKLLSFQMNDSLKKFVSIRVIVVILVALIVLSAFNTYLIFEGNRSSMTSNAVNYDYVLSQEGGNYKLKNMLTGYVAEQPESASLAINSALTSGKSVYLNVGTYVLTDDIIVSNKVNAKIVSDDATIVGNGHKIIVYGDDYTTSKNTLISGLTIINATIRVENSFGTTIKNTIFENTSIGIEFANTKTWSEYNKIENCQFTNATEGIAFRTPIGNATGSYASSQIDRCSFNIRDFSVGINVEPLAEFSDSQMQNVRFWLGKNDYSRANQTAILLNGSMDQTLLLGVVFESFTPNPVYLFGIDLGETCTAAPFLDNGVSFLGNWTARVHNPFAEWIGGVGGVFQRQNVNVSVGLSNQFSENASIQLSPLKIFSFKTQIVVDGSFGKSETVTVRIRLEYIDNAISTSIVRTFTSSGSIWLSDDEMMRLYPSQGIIWAILVDAKSTSSSTDAVVNVSCYGTAG